LLLHVGTLWTELGRRRHAGLVGRLCERERDLAAVEELLRHQGGVLLIEGQAGIGKTSLVETACSRAGELGHEAVRARGSELESGFALGWYASCSNGAWPPRESERAALLAGPAAAVRPLLSGEVSAPPAGGSSFAVLHGLYWLVVNLAASGPVLIAVDDAHWADEPSLRWLAYLAPRLEGLAAGMLLSMRRGDPAEMSCARRCTRPAVVTRCTWLSCCGRLSSAAGRWPRCSRLSCWAEAWRESRCR